MTANDIALDRPTMQAWMESVLQRVGELAGGMSTAAAAGLPGAFLTLDELPGLVRTSPDPLPEIPALDGRTARLAGAFNLDLIDVQLLFLAVAPEIDERFEAMLGYVHNDLTRRRMSTAVALRLIGAAPDGAAARARLLPGSPLIDSGLLRVEDALRPFPSRALVSPEQLVQWLLGVDRIDPELAAMSVPVPALREGSDQVRRALEVGVRAIYLRERSGSDARSSASGAAECLGISTLLIDLDWAEPRLDVVALARRVLMEARLQGSLLIVGPVERLLDAGPRAIRCVTEANWPLVLHGGGSWDPHWSRTVPLLLDAPVVPAGWQADLWRESLPANTFAAGELAGGIGSLKLRGSQVLAAAESAAQTARVYDRPVGMTDVLAGARARSGGGLERLARRVEPRAGWDDLILPPDVLGALQELVGRSRHRDMVFREWQLTIRGHGQEGLAALFDGPSGTGKTLGAEVVAGALGVDMYVVDLSTVVDKYIGETEKKLDRIFTEAESVNGILLFDEADALFGRRSEVKDSHDRYANVEVAYLLQRMESFSGTAILTTNLRQNVDDAFVRRLDGIVAFPLPEAPARLRLWERFLTAVPLADDADLDYCARQFQLSGGEIRNIAVAAAFMGAQSTPPVVDHAMLIRAVEREYRKLGRLVQHAEFSGYSHLLSGARSQVR